jgi:hypothetical protein
MSCDPVLALGLQHEQQLVALYLLEQAQLFSQASHLVQLLAETLFVEIARLLFDPDCAFKLAAFGLEVGYLFNYALYFKLSLLDLEG